MNKSKLLTLCSVLNLFIFYMSVIIYPTKYYFLPIGLFLMFLTIYQAKLINRRGD